MLLSMVLLFIYYLFDLYLFFIMLTTTNSSILQYTIVGEKAIHPSYKEPHNIHVIVHDCTLTSLTVECSLLKQTLAARRKHL